MTTRQKIIIGVAIIIVIILAGVAWFTLGPHNKSSTNKDKSSTTKPVITEVSMAEVEQHLDEQAKGALRNNLVSFMPGTTYNEYRYVDKTWRETDEGNLFLVRNMRTKSYYSVLVSRSEDNTFYYVGPACADQDDLSAAKLNVTNDSCEIIDGEQEEVVEPSVPEMIADFGTGQGGFTDAGEVRGFTNVAYNAWRTDDTLQWWLFGKGWGSQLASNIWRGNAADTGYLHASDVWVANGGAQNTGRALPKGAIVFYAARYSNYATSALYLGNNRMSVDGKIVDANLPEESWKVRYLGWIDPSKIGWQSARLSDVNEAIGIQL